MLAGRVGGARRATTRVCRCDDVLVEQRIRAMQAGEQLVTAAADPQTLE